MIGTRVVGLLAAGSVLWCVGASEAPAQRGMGDATGVARQAVEPEVVSLSGKITEVESGPCKLTTGRVGIGTHVLIETDEGNTLNVHLGPQAAVADVAGRLRVGKTLAVKAFRTDKMPEGHYVAQSLAIGDRTIVLRNAALQPVWAGGRAMGRGRGASLPSAGYGYAQGRGAGRGAWYCPMWGGPPQCRGPGWGAPARGPGRGVGPGAGQGRGAGRGVGTGAGQGRGAGRGGGYGQQQRQRRGPGYGRGAGR